MLLYAVWIKASLFIMCNAICIHYMWTSRALWSMLPQTAEFMRKRVLVVSICSTAELDLPITVYAIVLHSALKSGVFPNMTQTKRNASWAKSSSSTWGLSGLFVLAVANLANEVLVVSPIKRHSSIDQGIQQHPKGPAVHLEETVISDSWH